MVRLTCTEEGHQKFWEAEVTGSALTTRWGRLGTSGQEKTKPFADAAAARKELDKLVREKKAKGYVEAGAGAGAGAGAVDVVTDAGIVVLFDAGHFAKVVDHASWEEELLDENDLERHIAASELVPLRTGSDGGCRVDVRVDGALAAAEEKKVAARSSPYVFVSDGAAFVGGLEYVHAKPDAEAAHAVAVPKGRWSATVIALEGGKKLPDVVVLLAKAPAGLVGRGKLEPFEAAKKEAPAPKAAPAKVKNLKQAREAALAGHVDVALPVLEAEAASGKASAWAALAQIRAYRGDWSGALDAATRLLADPNDIYAGNVVDDAKWLLLRAARETGRWKDAAAAVKNAKPLGKRERDPMGDFLKKQAEAGGKLPDPRYHEPDPDRTALPAAERQAKYEEWMRRFDEEEKVKAKKKRKPGNRDSAMFNYARGYGIDAVAMGAWPKIEPLQHWDGAVKAARLFAANGKRDEAWAILARKIAQFWPVDVGQVAPIEPLVDEQLRPLMTPQRLTQLLGSPKSLQLDGTSS